MMQLPLKLSEVRHDQRRVAAMMQATSLRYHSIPTTSLYHSSYYNNIKYNYLLNRSRRPLVSNNADGVMNFSSDSQNVSLPDINGIKHLYDKYHTKRHDEAVNVCKTFPPIHPREPPGASGRVDQRACACKNIAHRLSSHSISNGVANFLPKLPNSSSLVDETWKVYNSKGLTKLNVRSFCNRSIPSESETPTTELQYNKTLTSESAKNIQPDLSYECDQSELITNGDIKRTYKDNSELHIDFRQLQFRGDESNAMFKVSNERTVAQNGVKLPNISRTTMNNKTKVRKTNGPAFRYTHRKCTDIGNLPTSGHFNETIRRENNDDKSKSSVKKPVVIYTRNGLKTGNDDSSNLKTHNKDSPTIVKSSSTQVLDSLSSKVTEESRENGLADTGLDNTSEETKSKTSGLTSDSDTELTDTDDSSESSDGTLHLINDSNDPVKNINDQSRDAWREAYVNALAVARSRRPDFSFLESRISRPFSFSYFEHVPYCKCKKCMERTMKNRGRAKKKVTDMKLIFGDVKMFDYYKP
ncbi:dentin sialophosphoprotein-like [Anneissia japonica]|uniref:dentin sialophosphoprotein-like n=1 Tax=Anneissia japonica TaxID=1529436 RepID=UPI0014256D4F|nr:dentin sialophosphoprotein-like [Anneissia japonica]XP_033116755.1 dentin sialophosphoprotein-like [Anneissia japonica]XP_033116756.1 dentin sialophosphoprotein-like [Anneissia japonica]XP_033116757.1 dentin sialophosphoprotein-like [Anneissia japonica]XP_033116758.1 dentin sialophosphoprotein-like [Anneissia japonica]XP_033116759.1 dentin sialophosphoprotein-like [Anneissia japonica]XP_033116761.1 dentin sialophosphoprotein-like [Anneissia japonica]